MRPTQKTANLAQPDQGARILPIDLDFTTATGIINTQDFDLVQEKEGGRIDIVQTVFIDNSLNCTPFFLTVKGVGAFGRVVQAAPFTQGYYELPIEDVPRFTAATAQRGKVPITFYNVALPYVVWPCDVPTTPQALQIAALVIGDNVIIPAVADKSANMFRLDFDVSAPVNLQFFDGASAGALPLTGVMTFNAQGSLFWPLDRKPWLRTTPGNALVMTATVAAQLGGKMDFISA